MGAYITLLYGSMLGGFHSHRGTPIARWFIVGNLIRMDDLGGPDLGGPYDLGNLHLYV